MVFLLSIHQYIMKDVTVVVGMPFTIVHSKNARFYDALESQKMGWMAGGPTNNGRGLVGGAREGGHSLWHGLLGEAHSGRCRFIRRAAL